MSTYIDCKSLSGKSIEHYFDDIVEIGSGGYGIVYSAKSNDSAKEEIGEDLPDTVALKKVKVRNTHDMELLQSEMQIMKLLDSKWTMKYYGCFESNESPVNNLYIVTELIPGEDLFDLILTEPGEEPSLTEEQKDLITSELALAINSIHDIGFIHRDLKPENIMYDISTNTLKLIDYGLSCFPSANISGCVHKAGTVGYQDPKEIEGNEISMKLADWWAYGQIIYSLYTEIPLSDESGEYTIMEQNISEIPYNIYDTLVDLTDPKRKQIERPDISTILETFING